MTGTPAPSGYGGEFWGPIAASAASSLFSGMFGSGDSYNARKRDLRKQYKYALKYQPGITKANAIAASAGAEPSAYGSAYGSLTGKVEAAKAAGLHPLFALGSAGGGMGGGGSAPGFSMPGQSETGSFRDLGGAVAQAFEQRRLRQQFEAGAPERKERVKGLKLENEYRQLQINELKNKPPGNDDELLIRPPVQGRPHPTEGEKRTAITSKGETYEVPPGTPARFLEDELSDWSTWMPDTMRRAFLTAMAQMGLDREYWAKQRKLKKQDREKLYNWIKARGLTDSQIILRLNQFAPWKRDWRVPAAKAIRLPRSYR